MTEPGNHHDGTQVSIPAGHDSHAVSGPMNPPAVATTVPGPAGPPAAPATAVPIPPPTPLLPPGPPPVPRPRSGPGRIWLAVLVPVLGVILFGGGLVVGRSSVGPAGPAAASSAPPAAAQELSLVDQAWQLIQDNYVDAAHLDDQAMAYAAIEGMTQAVGDEGHTSFLTADQAKAVDQSLSGTFVGIGIQVDGTGTDGTVITSVIPNTPAEEAGLKRDDRIIAVDGTSTSGETVDQVVARVRGPDGEPVTLTIQRSGEPAFDVTIVRRKFDLPLVSWTMVPGRKIALIRLDQFATGATKGIQDAVRGAEARGATAVILDLRSNPGGYVNEAIGVTSQFVGDGIVYRSVDASGTQRQEPVQPNGVWTSGPLVVLTDGNTASSAEIVTGAIQDAGRGTVVGEKTFGTGTVLGRFDLSDGSSLRIGVERWLTRDGRPIWHEGLEPDIKVSLAADATPLRPEDVKPMTPAELASSSDSQLLKALDVLKGEG
jgi:carboxyl-terminal processing protease